MKTNYHREMNKLQKKPLTEQHHVWGLSIFETLFNLKYYTTMKIKSLFLSFLLVSVWSYGQNKLNLKEGAEFNAVTEMSNATSLNFMGQSMETNMEQTSKEQLKITGVKSNQIKMISKMTGFKIDIDQMGQKLSFDSDKKEDMNNPMAAQFKGVLGQETEIVMKDDGSYDEMVGGSGFNGYFLVLPKDLKVGQKWTAKENEEGMKSTVNYEVKEIGAKEVTLNISGAIEINTEGGSEIDKMDMNGTFTGQIKVKKSNFLISEVQQLLVIESTVEAMGENIPSKSTMNITRKIK